MQTYQGSKIDQLVHEHVMGVKPTPELNIPGMRVVSAEKPSVPPYSSDIAWAMKVVERLRMVGWEFAMETDQGELNCWLVEFRDSNDSRVGESESTAPLAICSAALKAVGA